MSEKTTAPAWLDHDGGRLLLAGVVTIGRDPTSDLVLDDALVSWRHATLVTEDAGLVVRDEGSSNGTLRNGRPVSRGGTLLCDGDVLVLASHRLVVRLPGLPSDEPSSGGHDLSRPLRLGRDPHNDVVLDDPQVSRRHARVEPGTPPVLSDVGSSNGLVVAKQRVSSVAMTDGATANIGPFRLEVQDGRLHVVEVVDAALEATEVSVRVGAKTILQPTTLGVARGELIALIGESGSGKTTLLRALSWMVPPTSGYVELDGQPLALRRTAVGYVPQHETVHAELSVVEALRYAARLRLPSDTSRSEIELVVDAAIDELRLEDHANTRIGQLSGGQRKRVAVAAELVGQPSLLFLDEPTSGLDPALERRLMRLMRRLADDGRAVVVVTHATASLELCDRVAVMARGGRMTFLGTPAAALARFGVEHYDEIYDVLNDEVVSAPGPVRRRSRRGVRSRRPKTPRGVLAGRTFARHFGVCAARYTKTLTRDRRTLLVLLAQVPIIALLVAGLFPADLLARPDHDAARSPQFLFVLVTAAVWLGLISACRELVKEREITERELSVGLRLDAYLAAKVLVLFALVLVQIVALCAVAFAVQPLHASDEAYVRVVILLVATAWTSASVGLVVSALSRGVDQATSYVPLLLIPQLLFAGALVSVAQMSAVVKVIAACTFARWAFAGVGSTLDMNQRFLDDPGAHPFGTYGPHFFTVSTVSVCLILLGFSALSMILVSVLVGHAHGRA